MKKVTLALVLVVMFCFAVGSVMAMHHEIKIQQKEGIGKYFTDTEGNTLYWFKKDSPGQSACSGACAANWPVYYREKVAPPAGIDLKDFGTITREDGKKQTTFRGYPLYYFVKDKTPGDTTGQGVINAWSVVDPDNFPPK